MRIRTVTHRTVAVAAAALVVTGATVVPAWAEYPPSTPGGNTPTNGQVSESPAYTGSNTSLGLLTGLIVLGAGTGMVVASRRRRTR